MIKRYEAQDAAKREHKQDILKEVGKMTPETIEALAQLVNRQNDPADQGLLSKVASAVDSLVDNADNGG